VTQDIKEELRKIQQEMAEIAKRTAEENAQNPTPAATPNCPITIGLTFDNTIDSVTFAFGAKESMTGARINSELTTALMIARARQVAEVQALLHKGEFPTASRPTYGLPAEGTVTNADRTVTIGWYSGMLGTIKVDQQWAARVSESTIAKAIIAASQCRPEN
jgi:hypothetical protein